MYKKGLLLILLLVNFNILTIFAQQNVLNQGVLDAVNVVNLDTSSLVIVKTVDSVTPKNLRPLDSLSKAKLLDSLSKGFGYEKLNLDKLINDFLAKSVSTSSFQKGNDLPKGEIWVLGVLIALLILFAILNRIFSKQLTAIVQSFFSNRALSNLNKEDNLFTSWPFFLLFIQFGFTIGLFFYLVATYKKLNYAGGGFQFFLTLSVLIIILYVFKILLLKLMGYIFGILKPVNEYVSILYLSYFNAALLFIPLVVAFALSPLKYGELYISLALILLGIIFIFQFFRASVNILSHYRFPKVYLFLYFCTLEICPILILIKAIGF